MKTLLLAATIGLASWYESGRVTASGRPFRPSHLTCAHRHLPFGTRLRITLLKTNRSVICHVNDRGPYVRGRVLDLSRGAAKRIGLTQVGVGRVSIRRLG